MDGITVGSEYAEHITDGDLRLLLAAVTGNPSVPETLPQMLADPRVFDAIFGPEAMGPDNPWFAAPGR